MLKKKVSDLEQEKAIRADVLAASRAQYSRNRRKPAVKKTVSSPPELQKHPRQEEAVAVCCFGWFPRVREHAYYGEAIPLLLPQVGEIEERRTSRGRSTASGGRARRFSGKRLTVLTERRRARVHLKVGGQYLCATVREVVPWNLYRNSPSLPRHQRRMGGTRVIYGASRARAGERPGRAGEQTGANGGGLRL